MPSRRYYNAGTHNIPLPDNPDQEFKTFIEIGPYTFKVYKYKNPQIIWFVKGPITSKYILYDEQNQTKELKTFYKEVSKYSLSKIICLDETSIQPATYPESTTSQTKYLKYKSKYIKLKSKLFLN